MTGKLTTSRCRLAPVQIKDVEKLHALWILPEVRKFLWDDEIITAELTKSLVEKSMVHLAESQFGLWLVHLREDDAFIGFGGFWPFHEPERIELLFGLSPAYWGRGYATEIAKSLILYGKENLSLTAVLASTDSPNTSSIAVLQRLGMTQTHCNAETDTCFFQLKEE